ncbi:hypothetical protein Ga0123462_1101 [Mariprofundus ferrinatatus]|uniref:Lipoprotein-attachment site-containing protein n=1 Tax=Mariprofundus ferrinatatus TaxID=1921087 RepID=A0A2K8LCF1_9PROT|nr:hypothetical protein Ga0123462_1101 [Mariprofundus ferrinatatus]
MRLILTVMTLTIFGGLVTGCGVSVSPVPGVSIYIPLPDPQKQEQRNDPEYKEEQANQPD